MEPPSWSARLSRLRLSFWLFFLLTIAYMIWVRNYLSPLSSGEIVQLEVAKTVAKADNIIQYWKDTGKYEQGVKSNYCAYFFIILYTLAIGFACRFISACTGNEILAKGGRGFAWLIGIAAVCDIIENIAIGKTLSGPAAQWSVSLAYHLARVKFSLVIICILFILTCVLYWLIGMVSKERS